MIEIEANRSIMLLMDGSKINIIDPLFRWGAPGARFGKLDACESFCLDFLLFL